MRHFGDVYKRNYVQPNVKKNEKANNDFDGCCRDELW
jgi:hypothetical protein